MSAINRILVQTYAYELKDFSSLAVRKKGENIKVSKFVVTIETDDGLSGSYAVSYTHLTLPTTPYV